MQFYFMSKNNFDQHQSLYMHNINSQIHCTYTVVLNCYTCSYNWYVIIEFLNSFILYFLERKVCCYTPCFFLLYKSNTIDTQHFDC